LEDTIVRGIEFTEHADNKPAGNRSGDKVDAVLPPEMKLSKDDALDASEGTVDCADARVVEADDTPEFLDKVLELFGKHFNMSDALRSYVRGQHRCRTWVLISSRGHILAACTIRMNPYVFKSGCAWAQIMYAASSTRLCGFGKTLMAGVEELMWEERVDLYGLHSLRKSVDFWSALGLKKDVALLPKNESYAVATGYQRWIPQTDKIGPLPLFAKWLTRPYIHPPILSDQEGLEVQVSGKTRTVFLEDEKSWKRLGYSSWPVWRLTPRDHSRIEGDDLTKRAKIIRCGLVVPTADYLRPELLDLSRPTATGLTEKERQAIPAMIRLSVYEAEAIAAKAIEAGWKGKSKAGQPDLGTVLSRLTNRYKVYLPAKHALKTLRFGPFILNVLGSKQSEFTALWCPAEEGRRRCKVLVWSHEAVATAQLQVSVNDDSELLEPHCRCTWTEMDAVGYEFPSQPGGVMLTIEVQQNTRGYCTVSQQRQEPPDLAAIQGMWHSDRLMTFKIEDRKVILMSTSIARDGTTTPKPFGQLEYGVERHGWLRLEDFQMTPQGTSVQGKSDDQLSFKNFDTKVVIIWKRVRWTPVAK